MILPNDFAKTVEKSDKGEEKHGRRKQYEKKRTFRPEYAEDILRTHFNRHD